MPWAATAIIEQSGVRGVGHDASRRVEPPEERHAQIHESRQEMRSNGVFTADGKRGQSKKGTHDPED
jgi:hypothetical protein